MKALDGLSLKAEKGGIYSLLGPNAAGKTTAIKILVGLLAPDSGKIYWDGREAAPDDRDIKRKFFYIPDAPFLYDTLTGREFLDFLLRVYGKEPEGWSEKIHFFRMESVLDHLLGNYSHGYRQRLLFTAVLLLDPEFLILDEPLVGLDPWAIKRLKEMLEGVSRRGKTVFVSLHTLEFAEKVSSCIGIISNGRLIVQGTMEELRRESRKQGALEDIFLELTASSEEVNSEQQIVIKQNKQRD